MVSMVRLSSFVIWLGCGLFLAAAGIPWQVANGFPPQANSAEELLTLPGEIGKQGGVLLFPCGPEPKTLNPLTAADGPSREIILGAMQADLIHINRATQLTELALAKSWKVSRDGLQYTLTLRKGLRFSDGQPLDADDVLFTFRVYLDENIHATQRDQMIVGGKPITVRKVDAQTLVFQLSKSYGAGERLFDGLAILPRHLLEKSFTEGKLAQSWALATPANEWAGLGPFRLKEYVAGQKLVLERNPCYWKQDANGSRLPYLDELVFLFVPNADAQVLRFQSGETDLISRLGAENFSVLSRQQSGYTMSDAGPGLEYNFLFFNLSEPGEKISPDLARKMKWFREVKFRQAISAAVDRDAIVRLVYQGRGAALWGPVTPGNHRWANSAILHPARSLEKARSLLKEAGFAWTIGPNGEPELVDSGGKPVEFSILTSSTNADRTKMATLIQDDLKQLGVWNDCDGIWTNWDSTDARRAENSPAGGALFPVGADRTLFAASRTFPGLTSDAGHTSQAWLSEQSSAHRDSRQLLPGQPDVFRPPARGWLLEFERSLADSLACQTCDSERLRQRHEFRFRRRRTSRLAARPLFAPARRHYCYPCGTSTTKAPPLLCASFTNTTFKPATARCSRYEGTPPATHSPVFLGSFVHVGKLSENKAVS
jgi:ABC-type transport system substrate-binding protein